MLANLIEILKLAEEKKCAVGAFNTPNLECVNAVLAAAEKLNVPVIISHAELHEEISPLAKIGPMMVQAAKNALAPSFGAAHGIYKSKPVLDLDRVKVIAEKTGLPLVMHGGSGVSPEDYRTGIANGLRKINYYSYMSKAGTQAVKELLAKEDVTFFHDLALAAEKAMSADAEKAMRVFAGL